MPLHLKGVRPEDIGEITLLVGDPARVSIIAEAWDEPNEICNNREYKMMNGYWKGRKVSVCSTGIGISSTEIAVIELIEQGASMLVRVGGCGAWKAHIQPGDLIVNHAMVREAGTLGAYVPDGYPAAADPVLVAGLVKTAREHGFNVHAGIGLTTQTYYLGQGRKPAIGQGPDPEALIRYWETRGILNCEMETAAIYVLASMYGVRAANCLVAHVSRTSEQWVPDADYHTIHAKAATTVLNACFAVMD